MAVSAPIVLRLVTDKFDVCGDDNDPLNKECILASYRGKVTRKFTRYDNQVYGK